jgi:hypothetical protein
LNFCLCRLHTQFGTLGHALNVRTTLVLSARPLRAFLILSSVSPDALAQTNTPPQLRSPTPPQALSLRLRQSHPLRIRYTSRSLKPNAITLNYQHRLPFTPCAADPPITQPPPQ